MPFGPGNIKGASFLPCLGGTPKRPYLRFFRKPLFVFSYGGMEFSVSVTDGDWECVLTRTADNSVATPPTVTIQPLLPQAKAYDGTAPTSPTTGLIYFPVPQTATIEQIHILTGSNVPGDATFNVRKNDAVGMFAGAARPTVPSGAKIASKTGLSIAATLGDDLWLDLEVCPAGGVPSPIVMIAVMRAAA